MFALVLLAGLRETLTETVLPNALETLLALAIPALGMYVRHLILTKVTNEKTRAVLLRLEEAAMRAVKVTQQTFVEAVNHARADGKVTDAEWSAAAGEAKRRAMRALEEELGKVFLAEAEATLKLPPGGVLKLAEGMVEAAVHDRKLGIAQILAGAADRARDFVGDAIGDALGGGIVSAAGGAKPHLPHPNRLGRLPHPGGFRNDPLAKR